ncbi:MAG: phospholipase [Tannerella sp.]|jgi:hypothetical protein|nr:phospholipase [Tannerella sp.]
MWYLVSGIIISGIIVVVAGFAGKRKRRAANSETEHDAPPAAEGCCGQHAVCERDSLLTAAAGKKIEYYDDEELDAYSGKESNRYEDGEVEEFREVLYTMRETEVAGWLRSLQLRGINLPDRLKDEVWLMVEEQRQKK